MAIITKMPAMVIIDGFRHVLDFYVHCGLNCVRKWPKSPGHRRTPEVEAQWAIFKEAVEVWKILPAEIKEVYSEMALATNLTSRDMFFRGYISGTLRYYYPPDWYQPK